MNKISLIVTNWNGIKLLKKNLVNVIELSPEANEIIIADDASTDSSIEYVSEIQKKYKQVKIFQQKFNVGFCTNSNNAVLQSIGNLVVLLNNDISPHYNYISNTLNHFKKSDLFGVGFSELGNENWAKIYWKSGYLQYSPGKEVNLTHITGWLSGGGCIVDKSKFIKLGGFDNIYSPFYGEDVDLGYRAWKSGYQLIWEPKSIIEHNHESTTSLFPRRLLDYVKERNRLLNVWRNISDQNYLLNNYMSLIGRVLSGPNYIKIILAAKKQISNFPRPIVFPQKTDKEIFNQFL